MVKLGVLSDTHGRFDPAIPRLFRGVRAILHAGDIGTPAVIRALEAIAPVYAVAGNIDAGRACGRLPAERLEHFAGRRVLIRHVFGELHQLGAADRARVAAAAPDVVVFGHSHRPYRARLGPTLLFNPGSAGPRRFSLPRTVGLLRLGAARIDARIVHLD